MSKVKSLALQVPLKEAEGIRRLLLKKGVLLSQLKVEKDEEYVYLPVSEKYSIEPYLLVDRWFEERKMRPSSYKDLLNLPSSLRKILPTSFDTVGSILLVKIPERVYDYRYDIGEALLATHPQICTVCNSNSVSGELRTRNLEIIAGKETTITTHKEFGLHFKVDLQVVFFSPRLANERKFVAQQVQRGEIVVDMFAGVAPFSTMIASFSDPKRVYAVDKNKYAVMYALQNVKKNRVLDIVEVKHMDAHDISKKLPIKADRIIMNLPFGAHQFIKEAFHICKKSCIIHYYDITQEDQIKVKIECLKKKARTCNYIVDSIDVRKIKTYAPREFYIGMDITATKDADVA